MAMYGYDSWSFFKSIGWLKQTLFEIASAIGAPLTLYTSTQNRVLVDMD